MRADKRNWYAVYTKPRWEKKVYSRLVENGFEAYCPLNRVRKKWSDRLKWVEEPLFKSYVFVKAEEEELAAVRMVNGVVNFVYWLGKPAIIRNKEIEVIHKFLSEYDEVQVVPVELRTESRITILQGALMDKKATVIKVLNNKVRVVIESIGYSLVATIDKSNVILNGNH
ncbi:MAG TPA: UpxY family transcription antiterminator [Puia sp.]|nr:UpxY family transcription antiterminator [Puia sp.]